MAVLENFYDQVEGGGSGRDGNYGDSYELDRNTGGGGGGTPTRGGGGTSTQQIIRGCTDPSALNYNFKATVNSGCKYPVATPKPPAVLSESRTILVNVTSNGGGTIVLDGKDTLSTPSKSYVYSGKQLLTPKYFKIARAGYLSEDEYKLFSESNEQSPCIGSFPIPI